VRFATDFLEWLSGGGSVDIFTVGKHSVHKTPLARIGAFFFFWSWVPSTFGGGALFS
jgi:hypothetical protein